MRHVTDEEIFRLIDGECAAEEQALLQTHLEQCAACHTTYKELSAINLQLETLLPVESPSAQFTENVMEKLQPALGVKPGFTFSKINSRIMAAIAIGFVLTIIIISGLSSGWFGTIGITGTDATFQVPDYTSSWVAMLQSPFLVDVFLIVDGMLLLLLVDKAILQPYFKKKIQV